MRKSAARDMLFKLLGYSTQLRRSDTAGDNNNGQRRKEVAVAQRRLLKIVTGKHEQDM